MNNLAVGIIAVSTVKQGLQNESPESQREDIIRLATENGVLEENIKWFEFWESRAYEKQPVEEVIEYCKKNKTAYAFFLNIGRFTRAGAEVYIRLQGPEL